MFLSYARYISLPVSICYLLLNITAQGAAVGANFWLSDWSNDAYNLINLTKDNDTSYADSQRDMRLGVYGVIGFIQG